MAHLASKKLHDIANATLASNGVLISTDGISLTMQDGATLRTSIGLAIGTNVQAYDADLDALAGVSANGVLARTGAGTASARTITGTSNQVSVSNGDGVSGNPTLSTPQDIHTGASPTFASLTLTGNLAVQGTTTTVSSENVLLADNYTIHNYGYTTDAAQSAGFVVIYDPTTTQTTVNGDYTAGVDATSNPTVVTTGSATFAQHDIVQISGATFNNGLYEVHSHSGTTLTVRSTANGITDRVEDFTGDQLTSGSSDGATITKVNVAVMRASTGGSWQTAKGATTPLTYSTLAAGTSSSTTAVSSTPYTVLSTDEVVLVDPTSANITVDLPAAGSNSGRTVTIKHYSGSTNTVTVDGNSSETIDGTTTIVLSTRASATLVCDGVGWNII